MKNIVIILDDNCMEELLHALEFAKENFNVISIFCIGQRTSVDFNDQTIEFEKIENIAALKDVDFDIILNENSVKNDIANVLSRIVPAEKIWDFAKFKKAYFSEMEHMLLKKEVIGRYYSSRHPDLIMGDFSYGSPNIITASHSQKCHIGKFCSIASAVSIILCADHRSDWITTYPFSAYFDEFSYIEGYPASKGDVVIGNDVWIANGATILSGVTIGDGCVIGANAVVTHSVPAYSIVAGNPARIVKTRFTEETVLQLLEMKWWDWSYLDIYKCIPLLQSANIKELYEYYLENIVPLKSVDCSGEKNTGRKENET